jgi:cephalosporin-C deacetylase-like acetyl esterase
VVKFIGYGGGRGLPAEHALLPALGYSVFVMDTRAHLERQLRHFRDFLLGSVPPTAG